MVTTLLASPGFSRLYSSSAIASAVAVVDLVNPLRVSKWEGCAVFMASIHPKWRNERSRPLARALEVSKTPLIPWH